MKATHLPLLLLPFSALATGCSGDKTIADPGTPGGACLEGSTCNAGLSCIGNRCVQLAPSTVGTTTTATVGYRTKLDEGAGGGGGGEDDSCDKAAEAIAECAPEADVFGSSNIPCVGGRSVYAKCVLEFTELYCAYLADETLGDPCEILPVPDINRGLCSEDRGGQPCAANCAFPSGTLDCATACLNIASFCEERRCYNLCGGGTIDLEACFAGCNQDRSLSCANLILGCAADSSDCADYYDCLETNVQ